MSLILLTNDDGIQAEGLRRLKDHVAGLGDVVVVAPETERSAVSHGLTLHDPLRIRQVGKDAYAVNGTPADCVILALRKILTGRPDLVISGINHGGNLGDDIIYSGTVAAAREASIHMIPAFAVSLVVLDRDYGFDHAARFSAELAQEVLDRGLPSGTFLNVNVPPKKYLGVWMTRQGSKVAESHIFENADPRGRKYYWIGEQKAEWHREADSDYEAIIHSMVSITPLGKDQTDHEALGVLAKWDFLTKKT
ncbi:MAG: 5'/3'-nucleotidase SurE [Acidobacteria bacterium]|nr:5'/3'-nucleotidase SurE [Acidobacteriota bacterium]